MPGSHGGGLEEFRKKTFPSNILDKKMLVKITGEKNVGKNFSRKKQVYRSKYFTHFCRKIVKKMCAVYLILQYLLFSINQNTQIYMNAFY